MGLQIIVKETHLILQTNVAEVSRYLNRTPIYTNTIFNSLHNFLNSSLEACNGDNPTACCADTYEPCVLPWIHGLSNTTHQECANPDGDVKGLWCPTEVDENGYWFSPMKWGYCDENC